ncbi:hypothetical protein CsSME_00036421 [Camellia sinensis var. sinensis]
MYRLEIWLAQKVRKATINFGLHVMSPYIIAVDGEVVFNLSCEWDLEIASTILSGIKEDKWSIGSRNELVQEGELEGSEVMGCWGRWFDTLSGNNFNFHHLISGLKFVEKGILLDKVHDYLNLCTLEAVPFQS